LTIGSILLPFRQPEHYLITPDITIIGFLFAFEAGLSNNVLFGAGSNK